VGKTLAELDLREKTRALVIAAVRNGVHTLGPGPDFRFQAGDVLVLVGDHQALESAFALLGDVHA
jgi:TrkA domain protein